MELPYKQLSDIYKLQKQAIIRKVLRCIIGKEPESEHYKKLILLKKNDTKDKTYVQYDGVIYGYIQLLEHKVYTDPTVRMIDFGLQFFPTENKFI